MTTKSLQKPSKLNLGCGNIILPGYLNVDKYNTQADDGFDILNRFPYDDGEFEEVLFNHVIEHLPYRKHVDVLEEIHRILGDNGKLVIGYPEWEECAKAFIENKNGEKWSWWVQTLYGTQDDEGQYHVAPVTKIHLTDQLIQVGFGDIEYKLDGHDAVITCRKTEPLVWHF